MSKTRIQSLLTKPFVIILTIILLFSLILNSKAQNNRFSSPIDFQSMNYEFLDYDYKTLALNLTQHIDDDRLKMETIYFWLISNIEYKWTRNLFFDIFSAKTSREDEIKKTFNNRQGKCTGYSWLFEEMCLSIGIECYSVVGYSYDALNCPNGIYREINHAWNSIYLNGEWYLLDLTMDAGTWSKYKNYDSLIFLSGSESFIHHNLPANPMWQLLKNPVSLDDYCQRNFSQSKFDKTAFHFLDSIQKWKTLSETDKYIYDGYHIMRFNPTITNDYGLALMMKGIKTVNSHFETWAEYYHNLEKGRDYLLMSLIYLKPFKIFYSENSVYTIKDKSMRKVRRFILKTIKELEKDIIS